ncbi:hypothetical protein ATW55_10925 [Ferroacidibacillus organovorans]|uniref:YtkA-like domain-containing protein n=2 Tax=Ferroacidibacillus organovorans TaxID=1765683 RepID=A0A117SXG0_9BACL|nr:hypothetical protein ATW55_10925 [Ferroacidibacillus organovorans]
MFQRINLFTFHPYLGERCKAMMRIAQLHPILFISLTISVLLGCGNAQDAVHHVIPAQNEGIRVTLLHFPIQPREMQWERVRIDVQMPAALRHPQIRVVRVKAVMQGMSMPALETDLHPLTHGRFEGNLLFTMRGVWTLHFLLATGGAIYEQSHSIEVRA